MNNNFYICIGRQLGAGGLEVAGMLSKIFNIPVYDKELLIKASIESGISPEFFEKDDEQPARRSRGGLFGFHLFSFGMGDDPSTHLFSRDKLFKLQSEAIEKVASEGSAIFVGRCADYVMRDSSRIISAFIVADDKSRVERLRKAVKSDKYRNMSDEQIVEYMHRADRNRAKYYNFYTYKNWGYSSTYDICISSSKFSTEKCAETIAKLVRDKFGI